MGTATDSETLLIVVAIIICIVLLYMWLVSQKVGVNGSISAGTQERLERLRRLNRLKRASKARDQEVHAVGTYNRLVGYQNDAATAEVANELVVDIRADPNNTAALYMLSRLNRYNRDNIRTADTLLDATLRAIIDTDTIMEDYTLNAITDRVENPAIVQQIVIPKAKKRKQVVAPGADRATQDVAYFQDTTVYSDNQNVHDRAVSTTNKKRYKRLHKLVTAGGNPIASTEEVLGWVTDKGSPAARRAAEKIMWDNSMVMSVDASEGNVLRLAYSRIQGETDPERRAELEGVMLQQLADCEENGVMVCSTGRVSRVLDSFTAMDSDPQLAEAPKTVGLVRKEIFEKAHNFIQSNLDPEIRPIYEAATTTPEETERLEGEMTRLKNKFTTDIQQEYLSSGVEDTVLTGVIAEAIEGF